jgi:capsular exopolysaccharide synthesis family protein
MSKFFDETQRARQWAPQVPESGRLDVASVIEAIKLTETVAADSAEAEIANKTETAAENPRRGPIKSVQSDDLMPAPAVEAYGSLRTRVMKLKASKGIHSLMLTSSVSAEGKTLTSRNLALSCAKLHNLRILLVDADLRSRGLSRLLKIPEGPGLSDLLGGKVTTEKAILPTEHENLFVLGAGSLNARPSELFASHLWPEFIACASQTYGIVIVDAPPIHSLSDAELISAGCDGVLMVVKALSTPRDIAQKCVSRIDKRKLVGIVFNGLPSGPESYYAYYGISS